jgi:hypothetical protein
MPSFLLINKFDVIEIVKNCPWVAKLQIDNYVAENQFIGNYNISSIDLINIDRESNISNPSVEVNSPLNDMIRFIFQFKDIKEKFMSTGKNNKSGGKNSKEGCNSYSTNIKSNFEASTVIESKSTNCNLI